MKGLIPQERIERRIFVIRGQKVMLDRDLAGLYGVPTKALLQAAKRNIERFPRDFMFPLTRQEVMNLRSQFVTSNRGGRRETVYLSDVLGLWMEGKSLHFSNQRGSQDSHFSLSPKDGEVYYALKALWEYGLTL